MLTYRERKARLPFGAVSRVAEQEGVAVSTASAVLHQYHRNARVEAALCALMVPRTDVVTAFGPPVLPSVRKSRKAA